MKKLLAGALALGLVLSMGSTTAFAHGHGGHGCSTKTAVCGYCSAGCNYVDRDGDGICDYCDYAVCQKTGSHKHKSKHGYCRW